LTEARFDLLVRGGTLVDGTGAPRRRADVGVTDGVISFIGDAAQADATKTIDAGGLVVAPEFIDSHAHDDRAVLADPDMRAKLSQGVTTVINGNCGNSIAPYPQGEAPPLPLRPVEAQYRFRSFGEYLDQLDATPAAVNVAALVGHTALRACHVENLERCAAAAEIQAMRTAASDAFRAGALGLSSGTFYPPAAAATAEEIIAVGADLARHGGVYATHMRDEGDRVLEAIDEAASTARAMGVPLVVSHHKVMGTANFGRTVDTLDKLRLLAATQKICLDCYPYTASSSLLRAERLAQSSDIIVTSSRVRADAAGQSISALAHQWGCTREEALARVMPGTGIYFMMDEADVRRVLAYRDTMVGSDGISADSHPHPRLWGTFTRVLGHYGREVGLFSLETAVHKMTGLTARSFGLAGRGEIREGFAADLTIFDAATVRDQATYESPQRPSCGIAQVIVNGQAAWAEGGSTGVRAGKCLRRRKANEG
jgi:N-acyl-D-amino-acid deacylase